ncbi:MAG: 5-(carboxyamino)imidazole ribonucleotide synthase [Hyphomonadaceae bacterium]|nr:MAG: 5-(carboxyamino)imidazole ribonucleotide synthase [Caulobacteraceae bacterium]MBT9444567.1 5-(carboxyamino)imidazole ribonucleotide synthase [Hyphomonadaceae bacterium]TPW02983.1 MAG: 5-(carboxyamino)imidazole ribonucleotide synthase [Alphaproteobacteria bacterium]
MLKPGSTIGILGSGQLGRMVAMAAARLGFDAHVFTDETDSPASRVAAKTTVAAFDDEAALAAFAKAVDVVTTEFENVPARTAQFLTETGVSVRPGANALAIAQDRVLEKRFLNEAGVATTPFAAIESLGDLEAALIALPAPAILKTRRMGYDGKGQARLAHNENAEAAWTAIGAHPAILEALAPFEREISVVAARGADGAFAAFDPAENVHVNGILHTSTAPSSLPSAMLDDAIAATRRVADAFDYVGVLTLEFFVMRDGRLLANEIAPRVHNSGHWTEAVCVTSQFEQHVRAIAGWPLGSTERLADAQMTNLIGDDVDAWETLVADPDVRLHLYGKREARAGRKMGHYTRLVRRF